MPFLCSIKTLLRGTLTFEGRPTECYGEKNNLTSKTSIQAPLGKSRIVVLM